MIRGSQRRAEDQNRSKSNKAVEWCASEHSKELKPLVKLHKQKKKKPLSQQLRHASFRDVFPLVKYLGKQFLKLIRVSDYLKTENATKLVEATLPSLAEPLPKKKKDPGSRRTFDLSIAQTLLVMASVIYGRDQKITKEAYDLYLTRGEDGQHSWTAEKEMELEQTVSTKLKSSEKDIRDVATTWNCRFRGISELNSLNSAFCGIYYSKTKPVIVVAFKGTTLTRFKEILIDVNFDFVKARDLYGKVHQGFYKSLFGNSNNYQTPYSSICKSVNHKAEKIRKNLGQDVRVQVWVTGHSLGAAMASLLFAKWLECPGDLVGCDLRDCYAFASPAVGNHKFASRFASRMTGSSIMWRMVNNDDVVCNLPFGKDNKFLNLFQDERNFENYFRVGNEIKLERLPDKAVIKAESTSCFPFKEIKPVPGAWKPLASLATWPGLSSTNSSGLKLIRFIKDHTAVSYLKEFQDVRTYCESEVVNNRRE
ncbi:hypothetical protein DFQ28_006253 [Apophysomyces sp. BC1034]|nr:hypothetical protein DFQ28_006253 [Apophysomyces sp. BC1034]